jgi:glycosyltransferase involved in cell wall biosynthesis
MKGRWLTDVNSPLYTRLLERKISSADAITVSNTFLQGLYGGIWVPHARAPEQFPTNANTESSGHPTVLFCGSVRTHKGVDLLIQAWARVRHPTAKLKIIGLSPDDPMARRAPPQITGRVEFSGSIHLADVPAELARAAVVVVPQRGDRASQGQLPTRLIDAMAAGRAIVSTHVADIPKWLADGAGIVVAPNDVESLAAGIQAALDHPEEARAMGQKARDRFLRYGSFPAVRPRVFRLIHDLIAGRPTLPPVPAFSNQ